VRILFSLETTLTAQSFDTLVRELGSRGHEVVLGHHETRPHRWGAELLAELERELPTVRVELIPEPATDRWLEFGADVRSALDLFQFLEPRFNETYRARSWRRAPKLARAVAGRRLGRTAVSRRLLGAVLRTIDSALPPNPEIEAYLRDVAPDVVLFSPYLGLRSVQPEYLRAARDLGIRTGICVKSWDNLSSKSLVRPIPDRLFVWNEIQRGEAVRLHRVPADRVSVTGAQCFDEWFSWQVEPREEFCRRVGLDPATPFLLYTCCAPWTKQLELPFIRRWVEAFRAGGDDLLARTNVVVRPHPKRPDEIRQTDLADLPGVVVFPTDGKAPVDAAAKADFFDSIVHSAAVVGLNTSAMIDASIAEKPVLTVLDPEYERLQHGTLHFRHLLEAGGGLLHVAEDLDEHVRQLGRAVRGEDDSAERARAFLQAFIRPYGLDVAATGIFADEVERLATAPASGRRGSALPARALRLALAPIATRSARYVVD